MAGCPRFGQSRLRVRARIEPTTTFVAGCDSMFGPTGLVRILEVAAIGGPAHVAAHLTKLARDLDADELMLSTLVPALADRRAGLERIAAALV